MTVIMHGKLNQEASKKISISIQNENLLVLYFLNFRRTLKIIFNRYKNKIAEYFFCI